MCISCPQNLSLVGREMVEICIKIRLIGYPVMVGFHVRPVSGPIKGVMTSHLKTRVDSEVR